MNKQINMSFWSDDLSSGLVKKKLRYRKTRYRGLEKQKAKVNMMCALANLIIADWRRAVAA